MQNEILLFDYREWTSSRPTSNTLYAKKGFAVEMPIAKSRSNLLSMGPRLKDFHWNDFWKISIQQLQAAATRASKELDFSRRLIKSLVVCMRQSLNSTPIQIYSTSSIR